MSIVRGFARVDSRFTCQLESVLISILQPLFGRFCSSLPLILSNSDKIIQLQLAKAGIRLAGILNSLLLEEATLAAAFDSSS